MSNDFKKPLEDCIAEVREFMLNANHIPDDIVSSLNEVLDAAEQYDNTNQDFFDDF